MTLGRPGLRGRLAAALAAGLLLGVPSSAVAHGDVTGGDGAEGVPGTSEKQLRSFETEVLGPEHAAEHAQERALLRESPDVKEATAMPRAGAIAAPDPQTTGAWGDPFALRGAIGIHALMLPTGKVMYFSYPRNPISPGNKGNPDRYGNIGTTILWDPSKGTSASAFRSVPPPLWDNPYDGTSQKVPANIWCAGQTFLSDGRVVVVGGNLTYKRNDPEQGYYRGLNQVYTFNPWKERWTRQPDMSHGRWYPSEVRMPDGRVAIMGGLSDESKPQTAYYTNKSVELFTPSKSMDGVGKITKLSPDRYGGTKVGEPGSDFDTPPDGGLYPHLFWMLTGRVLVAGPDRRDSWLMKAPGADNRLSAVDAADPSRDRLWGSAVLLPGGPAGSSTVEQIGGSANIGQRDGSQPSTKTTETYTEGAGSWQAAQPLNVARSHLNTVLLPDKSMVTVGGGVGDTPSSDPAGQWGVSPVMPGQANERNVELYNPGTRQWSVGAAQTEGRAYHSTALLLPDARVISAGDDYNGPATAQHPDGSGTGLDSDTAEIYSPPYLFNRTGPNIGKPATRPTITSAPQTPVGYGKPFHLATATGQSAVLVAPGAVTHANDMNQRLIPLTTTSAGNGLDATAPANDNIAQPGCYMLFTLDAAGTPSMAKWIQLGAPSAGPGMCGHPGPPDPVNASGSPSAPKATPKSKSKPKDRKGPGIIFKRRSGFNGRRGRIYGKAEDGSGVKTVQVALRSKRGRRCRWFASKRRRFVRRSCAKPVWIKARLAESKKHAGVYVWRVRLHRRVRRGRYRLAVRAVDKKGNATMRAGSKGFRISVPR